MGRLQCLVVSPRCQVPVPLSSDGKADISVGWQQLVETYLHVPSFQPICSLSHTWRIRRALFSDQRSEPVRRPAVRTMGFYVCVVGAAGLQPGHMESYPRNPQHPHWYLRSLYHNTHWNQRQRHVPSLALFFPSPSPALAGIMVRGDCLWSPAVPGAVLGPFPAFSRVLTTVLACPFSPSLGR